VIFCFTGLELASITGDIGCQRSNILTPLDLNLLPAFDGDTEATSQLVTEQKDISFGCKAASLTPAGAGE
jgi:hypothetical protein